MGRLEAAGRTLHEHEAAHEQARPHQKDEGQRVLEHDEDRVRPSRPSAQAGPPACIICTIMQMFRYRAG